MSGIALFIVFPVLSPFEERGTTEGVRIRISLSANVIILILDLVFFIKYVKLCVCLCLRAGKMLNSRPSFDNFLTFKLNCFSVFSLIMGRKKDKFKDGIG